MKETNLIELPYERIAMAGGEMPDDLEWYDRQMFLVLRLLYKQYKDGIMSRDIATREKRKLLKDYDANKWLSGLMNNTAKKIRETEQARQAYRKNRTLENADAIILAFEGVPVTANEGVLV